MLSASGIGALAHVGLTIFTLTLLGFKSRAIHNQFYRQGRKEVMSLPKAFVIPSSVCFAVTYGVFVGIGPHANADATLTMDPRLGREF